MPQILFQNPNEPEQLSKGVYRWFYCDQGEVEVTIHVGCAGNRRRTVGEPSTPKRGIIQEAQRSCRDELSQGKVARHRFYRRNGPACFLKGKGHDCIWQRYLQRANRRGETMRCGTSLCFNLAARTSTHIFRLAKPDKGLWTGKDVKLAELHFNGQIVDPSLLRRSELKESRAFV